MKSGDFATAWGGIASIQLSLGVMWHSRAGSRPAQLVRWMSAAPAQLAGLAHRKGAIAPGQDADLVIWNPTAPPADLHHRHKLTPYSPKGAVEATFLRGQKIYDRSSFVSAPLGAILRP